MSDNSEQGAFACAAENGHQLGLTKREYFAAMAMQGMLANPSIEGSKENFALDAVECADALLSALEEKKDGASSDKGMEQEAERETGE